MKLIPVSDVPPFFGKFLAALLFKTVEEMGTSNFDH